jgi:hypothetical protein
MRLVSLLAIVALATACEEDMGQDAWVRVDNQGDKRVYVDYALKSGESPDDAPIGWVEAYGDGLLPVDACGTKALEARVGATNGPVVATRSAKAAHTCAATWVIEP